MGWNGRRAACGPPDEARAVVADGGGALTVLAPDDSHHGPECGLLPVARFGLGAPATTLALGAPPPPPSHRPCTAVGGVHAAAVSMKISVVSAAQTLTLAASRPG